MNFEEEILIRINFDTVIRRFNVILNDHDTGIEIYLDDGYSNLNFTQLSVVGGLELEWSGFIPRGANAQLYDRGVKIKN